MWQLEVLSMAALVLTMLKMVPKDVVGLGKRFAHFHLQTEKEKNLVKQSMSSLNTFLKLIKPALRKEI